jgi:hypothetical protein
VKTVDLLLGAALAALAPSGLAKIVAEAPLDGGAVVLLHDQAGPCVGGALLAQFVAADGVITPGCWVKRPGHVAIVFLDGDVGTVPERELRPPKTS